LRALIVLSKASRIPVLGKGSHKIRHFADRVSAKLCGHIPSIFPFYDFSKIIKNRFKRLKEKYLLKKDIFANLRVWKRDYLICFDNHSTLLRRQNDDSNDMHRGDFCGKENFPKEFFLDGFCRNKKIQIFSLLRKISLYPIKSGHVWSKTATGRKKTSFFQHCRILFISHLDTIQRKSSFCD